MRKSLILAVFLVVGAVATAGSIGCGGVEEAFDCHQVCQRYADCYDSGYDVSGCEDRCRSNAANDPNVQKDADTCESCIGDKSCLSATFTCGGSCGAIVP